MLKIVSKKSMLLLGAVLALCAFVLPSVASAASWFPVGTTDGRIDSANVGFSIPALGSGSSCTSSTFSATAHSAAVATITAASFNNCHGDLGSGVGCTTTTSITTTPWAATAIDTTRIEIHNFAVDVYFETTPGTLNECSNTGLNIRLTGTLTLSYTPIPRVFDFNGAAGLAAHIPGVGSFPAFARGAGAGTGLLNVLM